MMPLLTAVAPTSRPTPERAAGLFAEPPGLSIVVPFFNEEAAAAGVLTEIGAAADGLPVTCEIVAVDDGSADRTLEILRRAAAGDPRVRVLHLGRNSGQAAALVVGLRSARGALVATLDGDGQNDPGDLERLLGDLEGADMVVGIRSDRHDSRLRRSMSRIANYVRSRVLRDGMSDSGCALKVFRREVVEDLLPIRTLYSFLPAFAVAAGYRVRQRTVRHRPRRGGRSSYGLRQFLWRPLLDLLGVWWFVRRRIPPVAVAASESAPERPGVRSGAPSRTT